MKELLTYQEFETLLMIVQGAIEAQKLLIANAHRADELVVGMQYTMDKFSEESEAIFLDYVKEARYRLQEYEELKAKLLYT